MPKENLWSNSCKKEIYPGQSKHLRRIILLKIWIPITCPSLPNIIKVYPSKNYTCFDKQWRYWSKCRKSRHNVSTSCLLCLQQRHPTLHMLYWQRHPTLHMLYWDHDIIFYVKITRKTLNWKWSINFKILWIISICS